MVMCIKQDSGRGRRAAADRAGRIRQASCASESWPCKSISRTQCAGRLTGQSLKTTLNHSSPCRRAQTPSQRQSSARRAHSTTHGLPPVHYPRIHRPLTVDPPFSHAGSAPRGIAVPPPNRSATHYNVMTYATRIDARSILSAAPSPANNTDPPTITCYHKSCYDKPRRASPAAPYACPAEGLPTCLVVIAYSKPTYEPLFKPAF